MIRQLISILFSPDNGGDDTPHVVVKGVVGITASVAPFIVSKIDIIHGYLKIAALGSGLIISILTIVSLSLTVERKIRIRISEAKQKKVIITPEDSLRD